jgi:hypothetical protein
MVNRVVCQNPTSLRRKWRLSIAHPVLLGIFFIVAVSFAIFGKLLSYWFTGVDAFPLIYSNRLESVLDIPRAFTHEFLSAYHGQDIAAGPGFRPLGALTFALDYWLWQLDPFGSRLKLRPCHCSCTSAQTSQLCFCGFAVGPAIHGPSATRKNGSSDPRQV